jgi:selenocysteine lyase/cysteine desulfurase
LAARTNTARESEPPRGLESFLKQCPEYTETAVLDELRATEFARLGRLGHIYLDYTGGGLYGESQVRRQAGFLLGNVLGNPHSSNPTSSVATKLIERCRSRVAGFFNASPEEYAVIFTANASHALKLVGEAYPFSDGDELLLSFDNHNSANGIREFSRADLATTRYLPVVPPDLYVSDDTVERALSEGTGAENKLFVYPAQSNFSGVQHPLSWIELAQSRGWDVFLDAAAFVPTNTLDLGRWHPDYVCVSFYKMFGYPTGVGVLIARREALGKLRRPWFSGGTITVVSVQADQHLVAGGAARFEDGTPNYVCLPAVERGLDFIESVGIETIHRRVTCLTAWLLERMIKLKHGTGRPVVKIYGPENMDRRGATVAFNVYDAEGATIDHLAVEERANEWGISLRTGCFCNPGAGEMALGLDRDEIVECFTDVDARITLNEFRQCIDSKDTGAVRISLGIATNYSDVGTFLSFLDAFRES